VTSDASRDEIEVVRAFLDNKLSIAELMDHRYSSRERALVAWSIILTVPGNLNEEGWLRHPLRQLFDEIYLHVNPAAGQEGFNASTISHRVGWHETRHNYAVRPSPPRQLTALLRRYREIPPGVEHWVRVQHRKYEEQARAAFTLIHNEPLAVRRLLVKMLGF
jgi:hypothetical protein